MDTSVQFKNLQLFLYEVALEIWKYILQLQILPSYYIILIL